MANPHNLRDELRATVEARRELGPEYEAALTETFLERVETTIAERVKAETGGLPATSLESAMLERQRRNHALGMALGSLGIGLPLTGAAGATSGTVGVLVVWMGISVVNVAYALGQRRRR